MAILTVVFSMLLRVNIPNYPAWFLIGILMWRFFSIATSAALSSIIGNVSLVTKVHLSRYLLVLSSNLANLYGASIEFVVMLPLLALLGVRFTVYALLLPLLLLVEFALIFAVSLTLSSMNLRYRDFSQIWDITLQLGFFVSPLVYDVALVPARFRFLYSLNPVTALIESLRDALLRGQLPSFFNVSVVMGAIGVLVLVGFLIFHSLEGRFAEEL